MINRRRFLHDSLLATAGVSSLARAASAPRSVEHAVSNDTHEVQPVPVVFDLHAHPGATFQKGKPEYLGDEAHRKTVASMQAGGLTGAFFSLVADGPLIELTPNGVVTHGGYAKGDAAREYQRQLADLTALMRTTAAFIATRASELQRAQRERTVAAYLACEGGEFLEGDAGRVDQLYADGVRSLQLVHYVPNVLGDLQTQPSQHGGLSAAGKAVVKRLTAKGIVIDVAHASFETVRDVASQTSAPLILSHSILKMDDARLLAARAISVDHAKLVAGTGGVIGAWPSGFNASFDEFVANTVRLIDTVGVDHVGLGTDMDGNLKPVLGDYRQLPDWMTALRAKGLSASDVAKVAGGNMQRVLSQVIG